MCKGHWRTDIHIQRNGHCNCVSLNSVNSSWDTNLMSSSHDCWWRSVRKVLLIIFNYTWLNTWRRAYWMTCSEYLKSSKPLCRRIVCLNDSSFLHGYSQSAAWKRLAVLFRFVAERRAQKDRDRIRTPDNKVQSVNITTLLKKRPTNAPVIYLFLSFIRTYMFRTLHDHHQGARRSRVQ